MNLLMFVNSVNWDIKKIKENAKKSKFPTVWSKLSKIALCVFLVKFYTKESAMTRFLIFTIIVSKITFRVEKWAWNKAFAESAKKIVFLGTESRNMYALSSLGCNS